MLVSPTRQQSPHSTQAILDPTSPGLARPPHSIKRFSILCHTVTRPPGVGGWYLGGSILWRNQVLSCIVTRYYPASQYGAILPHNMVLSCVITTEMKAPDIIRGHRGGKIHRHQLSRMKLTRRGWWLQLLQTTDQLLKLLLKGSDISNFKSERLELKI